MSDPSTLSASEAVAQIASGKLSASTLAEAMLAVIAKKEKVLRAFTHMKPAQMRKQAEAVDAAIKAGRKLPLAGLFLGVKDVLDTFDQPSQYGSPIWAGHRPRSDAACVALARRAGAVLAKTVTTEFATRHPGPTTNPHNPAHTPGGSSSGSAAGVGAGVLHLAFGTQTAGSIIRPAAYCGAVGFKPSWGTLHRAGMKVMSESLDTIGLMARNVPDVALGMTALTGFDHAVARLALPELPDEEGPVLGASLERTRALGETRLSEPAMRGRALFFDADDTHLTPSGVVTCGTCHPGGGEDGLTWFLHTAGIAPKVRRTPPAWAAREELAPFHWDGALPDAAVLQADVAALATWFTDPHGAADWRRAVSALLAVEIRDELEEVSR